MRIDDIPGGYRSPSRQFGKPLAHGRIGPMIAPLTMELTLSMSCSPQPPQVGSAGWRGLARAAEARIEKVAEPVAEQVERANREQDREARKERKP